MSENKVRFCKKCVESSQRFMTSSQHNLTDNKQNSFIDFDGDGVCLACKFFERKKSFDWNSREKELENILDRHRKSDGTYSSTISPYLPKSEGKNMGDYWNEEIVRTAVANQNLDIDGEHIAPFPKQIITLPILQTSEIGDLVLDPFCGSGNVGKVCDVLERNFVGYDLNNYIS